MNVYFISGLGADRRAFQRIHLPENFQMHHIDWISPLPKETLSDYAKRLSPVIDSTSPFVLVGLSFGGIIAIEMSRFIQPQQVIIISSLSESKQLPSKYRIIAALNLHMLVPERMFNKPPAFIAYLFTAKTASDRNLLWEIFKDSPPRFVKWAVDKVLKWKNEKIPNNLYHMHGGNDRLIPADRVNADIVLPGAGHLMILTHASQVSKILSNQLNAINDSR